jgi:glycosyltransferase involved in cell wall biosynthesis
MILAIFADARSIHSRRWVDYFATRGHTVHWISLAPFVGSGPAGAELHWTGEYPSGVLSFLRTARALRRILARVHPDVLQVHSVGTYGLVGALSRFHPVVATPWGSDVLLGAKSLVKRPLIKFVLRGADRITCDAFHMQDALVKLGTDAAKIEIVFFGTDTQKFRAGLDGKDIRYRFAETGGPIILSTRTLEPIYNVSSLVRAMPRVLREMPNARCVIVGGGVEREQLVALAAELGVAHGVCFVGPITGEEMPRYLAAADIYVSTSLSDAGLAASTAEAMACELPVVVTDSGENDKWVVNGAGGYVVPVRDPDALATRLIRLAARPDERAAFGAFNRRVIEERNNYDVEMQKIERLYTKVAMGPPRR